MFRWLPAAIAATLLVGACSRPGGDDAVTAKKLDELSSRVADLDGRLRKIERMIEEAQGPPEPDPTAVYAVPIEPEDPVRGPATAKVTIVEGFEFA